jgi:small GTP-binding protein
MNSVINAKKNDPGIKIVLVGDSGVGKSSILLRFVDDVFPESYLATIGVDFSFRTISIENEESKTVTQSKLQVWDTAGQEKFRSIARAYFRRSRAIVMVYDVTSRESFEHIQIWVEEINTHQYESGEAPILVLVGNKVDLPEAERQVSASEARNLAHQLGIPHFETSAKANDSNVEDMFKAVAKLINAQQRKQKKEEEIEEVAVFREDVRQSVSACCTIL